MEAVAMQIDPRDAEGDSSAGRMQRAAAAGDTAALQCALSRWIASLNGLPKKAASQRATSDLLAALSAACQTDSSECVRDLIHATGALTRCYDCAPAALAAAAGAGSARALASALAAPELSRFLESNGPCGPSRLAASVAEALRSVLARGPAPTTSDEACLQLLLASLASPSSPVAAARAALAPHAPALLAAAAASDMRGALQALLVWLPDWAAALDACAADAARRAGRHSLADDIDCLLSLRSPCMGSCRGMEAPAHAPAVSAAGPAAPLAPALQALVLTGQESSQPWPAPAGRPAPAAVSLPAWGSAGSGSDSPCASPHTAPKAAPAVDTDSRMMGTDDEEALGSPSCSSSSSSSGGPAASGWGVASPGGPSRGGGGAAAAASAARGAAEASSGDPSAAASPKDADAAPPPAAAAARRVRAALLAGSPRAAALSTAQIELLIGALLSAPPADLLREAGAAASDCESADTSAQSGPQSGAQRNAVAALPVHVAEFWGALQSEPS